MNWTQCTACLGWTWIGDDEPEDHGCTKDGNGYLCPGHDEDDDDE